MPGGSQVINPKIIRNHYEKLQFIDNYRNYNLPAKSSLNNLN